MFNENTLTTIEKAIEQQSEFVLDFNHIYLIELPNLKGLNIGEKDSQLYVHFKLKDNIQKVTYKEEFKIYCHDITFIEDKNSYTKKLITDYLITEDIEFKYTRYDITEYNKIIYGNKVVS